VPIKQEFALTTKSAEALNPALRYSNLDWAEVLHIMRGNGWCIWNVHGEMYVLTMINEDEEIEVLLGGGANPRRYINEWVDAMERHPNHAGMTLRVDGRKGWKRLLSNWHCDADGVLTRKVNGQEKDQNTANQ